VEANVDHVVLWVEDPARAVAFYRDVIGLEPLRVAEYEAGKAPFPSVRLSAQSVIDLMPKAMAITVNAVGRQHGLTIDAAGSPTHHLCLAVSREDFEALRERLVANGISASFGLKEAFGARGSAVESFYFPDPDQNVLEARYYMPDH
jgi:glyoxylase I family protein